MNNDIAELQEIIKALSWNDGYGCYTRAGFEKLVWPKIAHKARWIIFFDIDDMHMLNEAYGYEGVNSLIRKSLKMRESDFMAGQWFSGDEFIVVITDDDRERRESNPIEFCARLAEIFHKNGVPATFAIAPVTGDDLLANVSPAHQLCQKNKRENKRGGISIVEQES